MAKKMLIDATHAEETRVVVVDGNKVEEFDFESENKRQLAGNIYLAKVTRVEPSLQAAFVDYGGNRHGFLAFSEIHPDYYQIPVADREALLAEERAYAEEMAAEQDEEPKPKRRRSRRRKNSDSKAETTSKDAVTTGEASTPSGMDVVDLGDEPDGPVDPLGAPADTATSEDSAAPQTPGTETDADVAPEPTEDADTTETAPESDVAETDAEETAPAEEAPVAGATAEAESETADVVAETTEAPAEASEDAVSDEAAADDAPAEEAPAEAADEAPSADEPSANADATPDSSDEDDDGDTPPSAETVADDDTEDDIRPVRKPRPKKYKIQEVVKVRQIMLVQVVKEERGNKGAALTTYLSLAGRYCVLMPNTARGGGISRKITNAADRKKLKDIAGSLDVPQGAGLIIRTAGAKRTKTEIKRDYEYLQRQWEQVRALTLESIAPAPIYEEGNLIHRSIRDLYNRDIDEVLVEGDAGYRQAKDFMKMIMPSHAKNVKHYTDPMPLFAKHKVEGYLADMFNPVVQLKSGGYIVIGVTEALVAIDVNSGRATKEGSIEETALKTNLEAAEEVARQLRLRDLAGLIVIDFIDMDDRRNNSAVEKRIKEKLKTDRARIQVGRISAFGLMEMSRQRLRPGMLEATTQPCPHCHGTGLIRSADSLALTILRQLEEEGTKRRAREVLVTAPVAIVNFIMNEKRDYLTAIEQRFGLSVRVEADPSLVAPDYKIERFKTATRRVPQAAPILSMDTALMEEIEEAAPDVEDAEVVEDAAGETNGDGEPGKRKRRRRRGGRGRRKSNNGETPETNADGEPPTPVEGDATETSSDDAPEDVAAADGETPETAPTEEAPAKPKRRRRSRSKTKKAEADADAPNAEEAEAVSAEGSETLAATEATPALDASEDAPTSEEPAIAEAAGEANPTDAEPEPVEAAEPELAEPAVADPPEEEVASEPAEEIAVAITPEPEAIPDPEPLAEAPEPEPVAETSAPDEPPKPKRRGWWSLG